MRLSAASVIGLAGTALAACPYADSLLARDAAPDASTPTSPHGHGHGLARRATGAPGKKGVMYMNRIGPSGGQLYIANADGSNATALDTGNANGTTPFDFHANWSPDGKWIVFTSERRGNGQADLYRVKADGSGAVETLVASDSFEDSGVMSPDGTRLAYISTAVNYTANLFVKDLTTGVSTNLTGSDETVGNHASPHGFFRPSWSPDGKWIAVSSDRNTDWTGHSEGVGWEHTQTLSIYVVRPNGSDFRRVVSSPGYSLGTPKWSPDGTRIVYNNMTTEDTYNAHGEGGQEGGSTSQLFTVDVATGLDVVPLTPGNELLLSAQYIANSSNIGYLIKTGANAGINYTAPDSTHTHFSGTLRNPSWSPDGARVVYEVLDWAQTQGEVELFSWDPEWDYRYMDVFPQLNNATGRLTMTQKVLGNASSNAIVTDAGFDYILTVLDVFDVNNSSSAAQKYSGGEGGAFQPTWKPDGSQIVVGYGAWFEGRATAPGTLYQVDALGNGSSVYVNLTAVDTTLNAGFPSYSPDGTRIVFRVWNGTSGPLGLHILDLESGNVTRLTNGWDNTPGWSPDGERIVFTRQTNWTWEYGNRWYADRFDVATIRPDGTDLTILTESPANDAHAVWSSDGRIMYNSGMYGFRDECAQYDNTFQPYGQIVIMNYDGSGKTMLTDSMWEDSMPQYVLNKYFDEDE